MKVRTYIGKIVEKDGARICQWPDGIPAYNMTAVEVHFDGERAVMSVYEPEPSYDEIEAFIKANVTHYNLEHLDPELLTDEDREKFFLIDRRGLAEFLKRYFIDDEGQETFPMKYPAHS